MDFKDNLLPDCAHPWLRRTFQKVTASTMTAFLSIIFKWGKVIQVTYKTFSTVYYFEKQMNFLCKMLLKHTL